MELSEIREKIDAVDDQLLDLFLQRMDLSEEVAAYKNEHHLPILNKERERAVLARLRTLEEEAFAALPGASEGLWRKLLRESRRQTGLEGLLTAVKSKRYTRSRLDRMVLCAFLGLTAEDLAAEAPYVRILGFRDRGRQALREMFSRLPLAHAGQGMESPYFALEQRCERLYGLFGQTLEAPELRERVARL